MGSDVGFFGKSSGFDHGKSSDSVIAFALSHTVPQAQAGKAKPRNDPTTVPPCSRSKQRNTTANNPSPVNHAPQRTAPTCPASPRSPSRLSIRRFKTRKHTSPGRR